MMSIVRQYRQNLFTRHRFIFVGLNDSFMSNIRCEHSVPFVMRKNATFVKNQAVLLCHQLDGLNFCMYINRHKSHAVCLSVCLKEKVPFYLPLSANKSNENSSLNQKFA